MNIYRVVVEILALLSLASPQAYGSITCSVRPHSGDIAHWSLDGGTITTDGTIGGISPENFESWELRFSSPSGKSIISSDYGQSLLLKHTPTIISTHAPSLSASQDHLIADLGGGFLVLAFADQNIFSEGFSGKAITFVPSPPHVLINGGGGGGSLIDNTVDSLKPISPFASVNSLNQSTFSTASGPLVIGSVASVPEPPYMLHFLISFSFVCSLRRMCRFTASVETPVRDACEGPRSWPVRQQTLKPLELPAVGRCCEPSSY